VPKLKLEETLALIIKNIIMHVYIYILAEILNGDEP